MPLEIAMNENAIFRRRDLPHVDVEGKPSFITACLHGSLPMFGLKRIRQYRDELNSRPKPNDLDEQDWAMKKHKLVFKLVDSILDGDSAVKHLEDDRLAEIVQNSFLHFADERYRLYAFVVMPSHHHWLFLPDERWSHQLTASQKGKKHQRSPREAISHSIQSYTGTMCNRLLGQSGSFWQGETFDHYARDEAELMRIISYIEQNPVVAGLVKNAADYRWSSAGLRKRLGICPGEAIPKQVA